MWLLISPLSNSIFFQETVRISGAGDRCIICSQCAFCQWRNNVDLRVFRFDKILQRHFWRCVTMSTLSSWTCSLVERKLLYKIGVVFLLNAQFEAKILSKNDSLFSKMSQFAIKKWGYGNNISIFRTLVMSLPHSRKMRIRAVHLKKLWFFEWKVVFRLCHTVTTVSRWKYATNWVLLFFTLVGLQVLLFKPDLGSVCFSSTRGVLTDPRKPC